MDEIEYMTQCGTVDGHEWGMVNPNVSDTDIREQAEKWATGLTIPPVRKAYITSFIDSSRKVRWERYFLARI